MTDAHVIPRQILTQGDPLYTFADWNLLWLKVPLFEADYVLPAAYDLVGLPRVSQRLSNAESEVSLRFA